MKMNKDLSVFIQEIADSLLEIEDLKEQLSFYKHAAEAMKTIRLLKGVLLERENWIKESAHGHSAKGNRNE